ncbi:hypothetical protein [Stappia sp. WLB 29]|uniref:hypothetical protein n=1 Tax=Stappia sp. WLB 29 TaxID=2925220 RepID=UPI0020BFBFB2|nr:hypothetical protein [Stappia sp. WLB 29]
MRKTVFCVVATLFLTAFTTAEAQESAADFAAGMVARLGQENHAACVRSLADEKQKVDVVVGALGFRSATLNLALEGKRLVCEARRLSEEAGRLEAERGRLLAEADRLDAEWELAVRANPGAFTDYKGRDRSQMLLRRDAGIIQGTIDRLASVASDLNDEAIRLIRLSLSDYEQLSKPHQDQLAASLDAQTQYELLERLLGLKLPVKAA